MELLVMTSVVLVAVLSLLYQYMKLKKQIRADKEDYDNKVADLAWKHKSNLELLHRMVKTRLTNLERQAKQSSKAAKAEAAAAKEREQKIKLDCYNLVTEANRYQVWVFSVKQGMESTYYPDKAVVIANSKEAAVRLVENKYGLKDIRNAFYDVVQVERKKNEVLLESYDIL